MALIKREQQQLDRLLKLRTDAEIALFDEVQEAMDEVEEAKQRTEQAIEKTEEAKQVVEELRNYVDNHLIGPEGPRGKQGERGPKGEKGARGEAGKPGKDGKGKDGRDGIDGLDGKDGSPDTGAEIVEKINGLSTWSDDLKIDASHIKNLPKATGNGGIFSGIFSGTDGHKIIDESTPLVQRPKMKFTGAGVTVTDDGTNDQTVVTINGGGGGGHTIQEEGVSLAARTNLNFVGTGITASDDAGNDQTDVTLDATLNSIAALGTAADKIAYTTGIDTWAETGLTAFGRSIIDDADEATFKATVNLEIGTDVQAYSADTAFRTDKLSVFAATTSAELAGVISDEVGTGSLVFNTSPTFTTSILPTVNDGTAIGAPTTGEFSDLYLAEGGVINWDNGDATLTQVANMVTLAGADLTVPNITVGSGAGIVLTHSLKSDHSDGVIIEANNGTDVAILGAGNTANALFYGALTVNDLITGSKAGVAGRFVNTSDSASVQVLKLEGDRATVADNDEAYLSLILSDSAGNQDEQARITWKATTVLDGATQDGDLILSSLVDNTLTTFLTLDGSASAITAAFDVSVPDEAYGVGWNGSLEVPTKNAIYDKIETLSGVTDGDKGDITVSGSGATWTIDNGVVTYAKMQDVSNTSRIMGRITAGAGDMEELTGTQATTLLDAVVGDAGAGGTKGLVPAPAAGDAAANKFLKADGTWTAPAGGGNVSKVGTPVDNQIGVWTGDGTIEGDANLTWDGTNFNIATAKNFQIAGTTILADAAGTTTLSNIDALDATTESTIEAAIDTLANLTSVQGQTLTLAGAFITSGANSLTLTTSGATNVTLPTTGTLATLAGAETLSNKTLTTPKFADLGYIADANGNELIILDTVGSAVNEVTFANAATGNNPKFSATGGDANIGIDLQAKGTGTYRLLGTSDQAAELRLYEDTDAGTNYTAFKVGAQAGDITYTLPTAAPASNGYVLSSTTAGVMSWAAGGSGSGPSLGLVNAVATGYGATFFQ